MIINVHRSINIHCDHCSVPLVAYPVPWAIFISLALSLNITDFEILSSIVLRGAFFGSALLSTNIEKTASEASDFFYSFNHESEIFYLFNFLQRPFLKIPYSDVFKWPTRSHRNSTLRGVSISFHDIENSLDKGLCIKNVHILGSERYVVDASNIF